MFRTLSVIAIVAHLAAPLIAQPHGVFSKHVLDALKGKAEDADGAITWYGLTLTQDYHLGKYEVTQAEFKQVMGFNPSQFTDG